VYTLFEGFNNEGNKTDVVPLNGAQVIMKSQFNDIVYVPVNTTLGYFIAVGSYLWDLNTLADGTIPNNTGSGTILGSNVIWVCSTADPEAWYPKSLSVVNKSAQSTDNFWNVLTCTYDETSQQVFLATDFAMYTFGDADIQASLATDDTPLNVQMLAFLPPYGAVCFERDADNQCVACPTGSYNEIVNITQDNGTPEPTNVCLYASNIESANTTASLYNGFPPSGIQQFTSSVTYFQLSSFSMLAGLWGSGGSNPNQSATLNSGGSGAYILGVINRDLLKEKYNTTDPWLICVLDYGKLSSNAINSAVYGIGGGLSGIFLDPQNGTNQSLTAPDLSNPILIAGGGGGGGSQGSQSIGGYGGVTIGGDAGNFPESGANNSTYTNNFAVSQMLSVPSTNGIGASGGAGFLAGLAGKNGSGGGGGTCFIDLDVCTPLESEDGNSVENYGGAIAFPGGLSSPLYTLPAGQTGQKGLISYILQDGLNTFKVSLQGGIQFLGLCPKDYTVFSPTSDEELFCRLDECLTGRTQDASGNYIGTSDGNLVWSKSFSSNNASSVMALCLQNALSGSLSVNGTIFKKAIERPPLPSQTAILPSYQNDNDPNQEQTISTITWDKSPMYPKNAASSPPYGKDEIPDEGNLLNWTNGLLTLSQGSTNNTNFGYVLVSKDSKNYRFVAPGVGYVCISDIEGTIEAILKQYTNIGAFNPYQIDKSVTGPQSVLKIQGYLPTYNQVGPTAVAQNQAPNDYLRAFNTSIKNPQSVLTVPFTLKNFTNIDTNAKRIMSTNFLRPRNWAFNFTYIDDGTGQNHLILINNTVPENNNDTVTYALVSDQPDENENNEFLYPDPMNVWTTINNSDPYKCIVAAPARAVYYTWDTVSTIPQLLDGADSAWFDSKPNSDVLYGLTTSTVAGIPYGHDLSSHYAFHYFIANDAYKTSPPTAGAPYIGSSLTNSATLNIFLNVSKLTDNPLFDWTATESQTMGTSPYAIPGDDSSYTLLKRLLGIDTTNPNITEPEFDPMYHFVFTDPTATANASVNATPVGNQMTLATMHHLFYSNTYSNGSSSAYCTPLVDKVYSSNLYAASSVLMYSKRLMVASVKPDSYVKANELSSSNFDPNNSFVKGSYTVPVVGNSNTVGRTALLWFVVNIQFPPPSVKPYTIGTASLSSELWLNKNQIVNAGVPTISVENLWNGTQEIAQIAPEQEGTTLADSGPKLSLFAAQPLVLTRYFQDRFQIYSSYYSASDPYRGMPISVPYYNVHQIFPRAPNYTYQGNVEMGPITTTIRLMDPEFFYVAENFANFAGDRPCTLNDGYNIGGYAFAALNNPQGSSTLGPLGVYDIFDNILVLGMAPKMSTTITKNSIGTIDVWIRNTNTNINMSIESRYNALLVEKDTSSAVPGISIFFNQSALVSQYHIYQSAGGLYETMLFNPDGTGGYWFYTPCVAAMFVLHPLDDVAVDDDPYTADRDYMYMVLENPSVQSSSNKYSWAFHIFQTKIVDSTTYAGRILDDGSGNLVQRDKNIHNIHYPGYPNSVQTYNGGGYYSFDATTATDNKYWLSNDPTDATTNLPTGAEPTTFQLMTSYQAEYIASDPTSVVPLPRVLKIPMPKTTYLWDSNNASFAFESLHNGQNNSQTSALWIKVEGFGLGLNHVVDFSDTSQFPDDGVKAAFMQQLLQNAVNNNNMKIAETSDADPDPGSNTQAVNQINIDVVPGTLNGQTVYYLQLTVSVVSDNGINSYYDDISIDVRCADPITRQVLGLSRVNKLFLEYELPYQWYESRQTGAQYVHTFADPMYFGPFSDTLVMMTPISSTNSKDPQNNLVPIQDDGGAWIKGEQKLHKDNASGFKVKFYRSEYDLPTNAITANMTYQSFTNPKNPNLIADIDNLFSIPKSYANSGALQNMKQIYPADSGTPLTNQLTLQSVANLPVTPLMNYLSTQANGTSFTQGYIDPLGTPTTFLDTYQNINVQFGISDNGGGNSFLAYRPSGNKTQYQTVEYNGNTITADDLKFQIAQL
jgi:hypothetical protein